MEIVIVPLTPESFLDYKINSSFMNESNTYSVYNNAKKCVSNTGLLIVQVDKQK